MNITNHVQSICKGFRVMFKSENMDVRHTREVRQVFVEESTGYHTHNEYGKMKYELNLSSCRLCFPVSIRMPERRHVHRAWRLRVHSGICWQVLPHRYVRVCRHDVTRCMTYYTSMAYLSSLYVSGPRNGCVFAPLP